jgi:hypothetical protein
MIGVHGALSIGFLLLLFLLLVAARGVSAARELSSRSNLPLFDDGAELAPCSPKFVSRIFSRDDCEFVSGMKSQQLQQLFHRERKVVALLWVQQTSAAIRRTMREHARVARGSDDLEFATEVKLALLYLELMLLCGVLFVAIQSAGPLWLGQLAGYLQTHSQRLAQAQQSFKTAAAPRELQDAGS